MKLKSTDDLSKYARKNISLLFIDGTTACGLLMAVSIYVLIIRNDKGHYFIVNREKIESIDTDD